MFGQVAIARRLAEHQLACGIQQVSAFASPQHLFGDFFFSPFLFLSLKLSLSEDTGFLALLLFSLLS